MATDQSQTFVHFQQFMTNSNQPPRALCTAMAFPKDCLSAEHPPSDADLAWCCDEKLQGTFLAGPDIPFGQRMYKHTYTNNLESGSGLFTIAMYVLMHVPIRAQIRQQNINWAVEAIVRWTLGPKSAVYSDL